MQLIFFIFLAAIAVAAAAGVVLSRNPVYSALSLLVNFAVLALMFISLHAQFLAIVQIIVYAGAIVVLFLFVIMLIGGDLKVFRQRSRARQIAAYVALVVGVLLLIGLGYVVVAGALSGQAGNVPGNGAVQVIGEVLFTRYVLPFELASVLLLVAMIGAVVLARKPSKRET